jgi:hypothetical protein
MKEKLSILTELIKLAKIDKQFRDEEYRFILRIAELLEVDKKQLDNLFTKYVDFTPPPLEFDRILQFQRLVLLANFDWEVNEAEINMLKKAGLKLGLNLNAVDIVLQEMKKHEKGIIPSDKLIEIFKVYHS